jgi:hypothetical protein
LKNLFDIFQNFKISTILKNIFSMFFHGKRLQELKIRKKKFCATVFFYLFFEKLSKTGLNPFGFEQTAWNMW